MEIKDLIEKWQEAIDTEDDWTVKNLAQEFIDDLKDLTRGK
jgi:hypothetical protein